MQSKRSVTMLKYRPYYVLPIPSALSDQVMLRLNSRSQYASHSTLYCPRSFSITIALLNPFANIISYCGPQSNRERQTILLYQRYARVLRSQTAVLSRHAPSSSSKSMGVTCPHWFNTCDLYQEIKLACNDERRARIEERVWWQRLSFVALPVDGSIHRVKFCTLYRAKRMFLLCCRVSGSTCRQIF